MLYKHREVVAWLLSHGADVNGSRVMYHAVCNSTPAILQLLIDAGADVNRESGSVLGVRPPLIWAMAVKAEVCVRLLLAHPATDVTAAYMGRTAEQVARDRYYPALGDLIAHEASRDCVTLGLAPQACNCLALLPTPLLFMADAETGSAGTSVLLSRCCGISGSLPDNSEYTFHTPNPPPAV